MVLVHRGRAEGCVQGWGGAPLVRPEAVSGGTRGEEDGGIGEGHLGGGAGCGRP